VRRHTLVAAGLLALLSCATQALHHRAWVEVETRHFEIVSSLGEEATLELARDAELFHAAVEFVVGLPLPPGAAPLRIYAFDGRGFSRPFAVRGAPSALLESPREALLVLRTGGGWRSDATRAVRHAYVHYLLRNQLRLELPLWFDEGVAVFLSTADVGGNHAVLGKPPEETVKLLRREQWVPLGRILEAHSLQDWGPRKRAVFAAEAWAFAHYLNFGPEGGSRGRAQLADYLRAVQTGTPYEQAVEQAFGRSSAELDRDVRRYARGERFDAVAVRLRRAGQILAAETRSLPPDEVSSRLGWLSLTLDRPAQAERHFRRALAREPANARAHSGLGAVARLERRWDEALAHHRRALERAPDDPLGWLDACVTDYARGEASPAPDVRAEAAAEVRRLCARSLELDPRQPEANAVQGASYLLDAREPERSRAALERAHAQLPASFELQLELARLLALQGEPARARELAVGVLSRTDSNAVRSQAEAILATLSDSSAPDVAAAAQARERPSP
jgi:tetratricopeptide (TPR) repeat protein